MATCPYCKSEMADHPPVVRLSIKKTKVYETILGAGPEGISIDSLMSGLFPERSPVTLRSCIYNINQLIKPMKIKGRSGYYYVEAIG